jgi:hypothetical protein
MTALNTNRRVSLNGMVYSRRFILDAARVVYGLSKTDLAQAKLRVIKAEYSATPEGVVLSFPKRATVRLHYSTLVDFSLTSRWFQRGVSSHGKPLTKHAVLYRDFKFVQ